MPSRLALITFVDADPVDPGYGVGAPGHPSHGLPWGPGHPSQGLPWGPGHPSQGLPWGPGHVGGGPVYPPGHPSAGLPIAPGHPGNALPPPPGHVGVWPPVDDAGKPVDPEWGYSPHFGWILIYCKAGGKVDNTLPATPEPK
jgi:hypothetical protein